MEKSSPIPVRPLLFVHYPKHMEQLVKETSSKQKAVQFQSFFGWVKLWSQCWGGEIISVSPTLYDASRTVCQLEEALKFHLDFDDIPFLFPRYSRKWRNLGLGRFDGTHGGAKPVRVQIRHFQFWPDCPFKLLR